MQILNDNNLEKYLVGSEYVLVDFYATWCGPCTLQTKVLEIYEKERPQNVNVIKVNVDKFEELAEKYNIVAVPTLIFFKAGNIVYKHEGYLDLDGIKNKIAHM